MKKLILLALLFTLSLSLSACGDKDLRDTIKKLNDSDNYSLVTETQLNQQKFNAVALREGDRLGYSSDFEEFIMERDQDRFFIYTPITQSSWNKREIDEDDFFLNTNFIVPTDHLKARWFTYEDGAYFLDESHYDDYLDHEFFHDFDIDELYEMAIEIGDDGIYYFIQFKQGNDVINISAIFYDYDQTAVSMPNVT
ncbi:MAG: hypothetical protein ACLFRI_06565 [Candidatus Izemoplasmataceae bacterium]